MCRNFIGGLVSLTLLFCTNSWAGSINFDDVAPGNLPGDTYEDHCVLFSTGRIPDTISVGAVVTLTSIVNQFEVANDPGAAISNPNLAFAIPNGDLLMTFTEPVTNVSITTDEYSPESGETVRLISLEPTGNPNEFTVIQFDEGLDNATTSPDNLLSLSSATPFSYVIFQTLNIGGQVEREGFDNLTFTKAVPEPSSLVLLALTLGGWAVRRRVGAA
jgi:hypothetical protein